MGFCYFFGLMYLNVKMLFLMSYGLSRELDFDEVFKWVGMKMEGIFYWGVDDVWNIGCLFLLFFKWSCWVG